MASKKTKKPTPKASASRTGRSARTTVKNVPARSIAKKSSATAEQSSTVQLLVVIFALLSVIFMAMAYYAYS
ncbi:MAG TPA: hypothetical protein VF733_04485 [Candidatus Saccharimonadales bacterium]